MNRNVLRKYNYQQLVDALIEDGIKDEVALKTLLLKYGSQSGNDYFIWNYEMDSNDPLMLLTEELDETFDTKYFTSELFDGVEYEEM